LLGCVQALLPSLPHLAHLNLYRNWEFGDEQLAKCIVHMLGLVSLDLRGTLVTSESVSRPNMTSRPMQLVVLAWMSVAPVAGRRGGPAKLWLQLQWQGALSALQSNACCCGACNMQMAHLHAASVFAE
jgi:hypothetical protein